MARSETGLNEIEKRFTYHPPKEGQPEIYELLRAQAMSLAVAYDEHVPMSRELALALTKLEESVMWANAGIARRS